MSLAIMQGRVERVEIDDDDGLDRVLCVFVQDGGDGLEIEIKLTRGMVSLRQELALYIEES